MPNEQLGRDSQTEMDGARTWTIKNRCLSQDQLFCPSIISAYNLMEIDMSR